MISKLVLIAGIAMLATPAAASTTSGLGGSAPKGHALQVAQGATPEGWRKEGEPRYKKKSTTQTQAIIPAPGRPEGEPRYKKK
jgi:hypothetical protein